MFLQRREESKKNPECGFHMASHRYTTEQVTSAKYDNGTHVMGLRVHGGSFQVQGSISPAGTGGSDQFYLKWVSFESLRSILDESQLRQVFSTDVRLNQFCQKSASKFPGKRTIPPVAAHTAGAAPTSTAVSPTTVPQLQPSKAGCDGLGSLSRRKRCQKRKRKRVRKRFLKRCELRTWKQAPFQGLRKVKAKCRALYKSKKQAKAECRRNFMKNHRPDFMRLYEAGFFGKPGKSMNALLRKEAKAFCRRTRKDNYTKL